MPIFSTLLYMIRRLFLRRDARSAMRGIAIVSRPSVCLSVPSFRLSVRPSLTLMYRGRIAWTSSKLITRIICLGSRSHNVGNLVQGTNVTIDDQ